MYFSIGLVAVLLDVLWLLQGLGIVHLRPILCFTDCDPVHEPSAKWAVTGAAVLAVGVIVMLWPLKRQPG